MSVSSQFVESRSASWHRLFLSAIAFAGLLVSGSAVAQEDAPEAAVKVKYRTPDGKESEATGKKILQAADGGILMMTDDGEMVILQPENTLDVDTTVGKYQPASAKEVAKRLTEEMPGFSVFQTAHYTIAYNGTESHARAVAQLLEQTHRSFFTYWKNQREKLQEPEWPLVALVFQEPASYVAYSAPKVGERVKSLLGFYDLNSNRIYTHYVRDWERNLATIVHEATHQLCYNTGLQERLSNNPVWLSEGLAMFFEAADRRNTKSFRGVGKVNNVNLKRWYQYFRQRPADSLSTLIATDDRLQNEATVAHAYGESWALTYFLLRTRKKQYLAYLQSVREQKPLIKKSPRERIQQFEAAMGTTIGQLDRKFVAYMRTVRPQ